MATFPELSSGLLGPAELSLLEKRLAELRGEFETEERQDAARAGAARSAYEDLAGAPLPEQGIGAGIQQLFGDMGSILSRRPEFGERSREDIKQRGAMLLQQRMQNVQILRDRYQEEASKIGKLDPVKSLEFSEKVERMNKVLEQLHERNMATFNADAAMERTQEQVRGDIEVAKINSDSRLLNAMLRGGTDADGKPLSPKDYEGLLNDIDDRYIVKGKPMDKKTYHIYKSQILAMQPAVGMTERQWIAKMTTKLTGARNGKKLSPEEVADIVRHRALHTFPETEAASTELPRVSGTETEAPMTTQEFTVETPSGYLGARDNIDVSEITRLVARLRQPVTGPTDAAVRQRANQRIRTLVEQLRARGVIIRFPATPIEGTETEAFADDFLQQEAVQ